MATKPPRTVAARVPAGVRPRARGATSTTRQPRDGCVVPVAPLSTVLRGFMDEFARQHPPTSVLADPDSVMLTPADWLIAASERQAARVPDGRPLTSGTIRNVLERRITFAELRTADMIVTSIRKPWLLTDGTLPILPNPAASKAARAECCGGSTVVD